MPAPVRLPPRGSLKSWRRAFKAAVKDKFLVRFHMALILAGVIAVGMLANKLLYKLGVPQMEVRYPVAVFAAYLAFFAGVWMWIGYVQASTPKSLLEPALAAPAVGAALAADPGGLRRRKESLPSEVDLEDAVDVVDVAGDGLDALGSADDDGIVWMLLLLLVAAIFVAAGWLVWQAPAILSEAAFSATLAGAVRTAARGEDGPSWAWHVLKKSIVPFAAVAVLAGGVGHWTHEACPAARTLKTALHCEQGEAEFLAE